MIFVLLAMVLRAVGSPIAPNHLGRMENLVTFGDSYTDEGRLAYFFEHRRAPPLGQMLPPSDHTASGGYAWGRIVANAAGARYYNYAVSGSQCTNNIDSRNLDVINGPFPSVLEYEIPAFEQDVRLPNLYPDRRADNTIYGLWIGTNDIGIDGILGDSQKQGTTLSTYVDCVWNVFDHIYRAGGRHFVLLNLAPLDHAPMYATPDQGGMGNHQFWRNKTAYNVTEYTNKMLEYTTSVNTMFDYGAPFHLKVTQRWQGASFSIFDVHSLMMDVIASPSEYLDAPANVSAPFRSCLNGCVDAQQPKSSFMWYDELHPSERMDEIIARNFIDVVQGKSEYRVTYT